jgi:hypothetical protein
VLARSILTEDLYQIASEIKAFLSFGWQAEWDVQSIKDVGCKHTPIYNIYLRHSLSLHENFQGFVTDGPCSRAYSQSILATI